jgi:hypothetical protein
MADAEVPKKRTFRKFTYRGVDLEKLLELNTDELVLLFHARARRRYCFPSELCLILCMQVAQVHRK